MAKKNKHAEEHENHERWLVSYADFITLLFATFVVLYALAQADVSSYTKLHDSIHKAFAAPSLLQGGQGVMSKDGSSMVYDKDGDTAVPPILEYINSAKFENDSFNNIKNTIDNMTKEGSISGVNAQIDERGLVIDIYDLSMFFGAGSAELMADAHSTIDKVAQTIASKFSNHAVRIEGHTDNQAISTAYYPSNWELSSARASSVLRYMLDKFKFNKNLFSAIGYADTKPITTNDTPDGRLKNRRVSIVILRNKFSESEPPVKVDTDKNNENSQLVVTSTNNMSDAAKKLMEDSGQSKNNVLILSDNYDKESQQLSKELKNIENQKKHKLNFETETNSVHNGVVSKLHGQSGISDAAQQLLDE